MAQSSHVGRLHRTCRAALHASHSTLTPGMRYSAWLIHTVQGGCQSRHCQSCKSVSQRGTLSSYKHTISALRHGCRDGGWARQRIAGTTQTSTRLGVRIEALGQLHRKAELLNVALANGLREVVAARAWHLRLSTKAWSPALYMLLTTVECEVACED